MKKISILLVALLLIVSCQSSIHEDNYKILDIESAKEQIGDESISSWLFKDKSQTILDNSEVRLLTNILDGSIESYNKKRKDKSRQIDVNEYRFFVIPTINKEEDKVVYIYAYIYNEGDPWYELADWFGVDDGGTTYFRTVINLTQKIEGWIVPNGVA